MILPWIDIATHAFAAGFRGDTLAVAVALTQPESGRNPDAVNDKNTDGSVDRGLWQINSVHLGAGGVLDGWAPDSLFDPRRNAQATWMVYQSAGSFSPWVAFQRNLHASSMDAAKCAMDARQRLEIANRALESCERDNNYLGSLVSQKDNTIQELRGRILTGLESTRRAVDALTI